MGPAIPLAAGQEVARVEARFGHFDGRWYGTVPALHGCMVEDQSSEVSARRELLSLLCKTVSDFRRQAQPVPWIAADQIPPANWDESVRTFAIA